MTSRISHFLVETDDKSEISIDALQMLRHVEDVTRLPDGNILVVLDGILRDEDEGFAIMERTVRKFAFVRNVAKCTSIAFSGSDLGVKIASRVIEVVAAMRPAPPKDEKEFEGYVQDIKAWKRGMAAIESGVFY